MLDLTQDQNANHASILLLEYDPKAEVKRLKKTLLLIRAGVILSQKMSGTINGQELINIIDEALK